MSHLPILQYQFVQCERAECFLSCFFFFFKLFVLLIFPVFPNSDQPRVSCVPGVLARHHILPRESFNMGQSARLCQWVSVRVRLYVYLFILRPLLPVNSVRGTQEQSESDSDPSAVSEYIWGHRLPVSHTSPILLISPLILATVTDGVLSLKAGEEIFLKEINSQVLAGVCFSVINSYWKWNSNLLYIICIKWCQASMDA